METNRYANMTQSMDGPYKIILDLSWNNTRFTRYMVQSSVNPYFILKLTGGMRNNLMQAIENKKVKIRENSIVDTELLPYYKNILMIRTYNPTQKMVERIKRIYHECPNRKFILSMNVSIDSFDVEDDMDVYGQDLKNFSSDNDLIEAIPDLLKERKYAFVQFDNKYYYKNVGEINKVDSLKKKSEQRKLYRLKKNLVDLIEYFGDMVHIYTERNVFDRFGRHNLNNIWNRSVAWNYHNECTILALEKNNKIPINKINRLWVVEDDVEYTGNIDDFFNKYDGVDLDLLEEKSLIMTNDIFLRPCTTRQFKSVILKRSNKHHKAYEHIICMSGKFIDSMVKLLNSGYNGYSETSTISYCYYLNMKYVDIDPKNFSKQFNHELDAFDNSDDVEEYVNKLRESGDKLLVHPCKY